MKGPCPRFTEMRRYPTVNVLTRVVKANNRTWVQCARDLFLYPH